MVLIVSALVLLSVRDGGSYGLAGDVAMVSVLAVVGVVWSSGRGSIGWPPT